MSRILKKHLCLLIISFILHFSCHTEMEFITVDKNIQVKFCTLDNQVYSTPESYSNMDGGNGKKIVFENGLTLFLIEHSFIVPQEARHEALHLEGYLKLKRGLDSRYKDYNILQNRNTNKYTCEIVGYDTFLKNNYYRYEQNVILERHILSLTLEKPITEEEDIRYLSMFSDHFVNCLKIKEKQEEVAK